MAFLGRTIYGGVFQKQINETTSSLNSGSFSGSFPPRTHGTYGTSSYAAVVFSGDRGFTGFNTEESAGLPTPPAGGTASTFKMTGYFTPTGTWETWTSSGTPNTSPPSGHALNFVSYIVTSGGAN